MALLTSRVKLRQNGIVSFPVRLGVRGQRRRSYETAPKWHGFLMITLAALAAGSRAEQRTAEYRIANFEVWNRFAPSFYKNR